VKDDRVCLGHSLRCIARIEEYTAEGRDRFFASHLVQDGVIRNLQTLTESSRGSVTASRGCTRTWTGKDWLGFEMSWFTIIWVYISSTSIVRSNATFPA